MNLKYANNSLLLKEQDCPVAVLLLLFLSLPLTALFPHAHIASLLWVAAVLFCVRRRGPITLSGRERVFLLFLFLTLSGAVLPESRGAAILAFLLRLSFFVPLLLGEKRVLLRWALALLGGALGALSLLSLLLGLGKEGYTDLRAGMLARAAPVFGNPNALAAFLLPCTLFALHALLLGRRRVTYALLFVLGVGGILATYSRGAMLALGAGILLLFCARLGTVRTVLLVFSALPLATLLLPPSLSARLASLSSPDSSVTYRFSLWRSVLRLSLSQLLFGVGEGKATMTAALRPVLASGLLHVEHTHSLFLHFLLSDGVVGLALFLLFTLVSFFKKGDAGAKAAVASLLLFGLFDDPLYLGQTEVIFWLSFGLM